MKSLSETKWTMSVDLSKLNRSAQDKKESSFLKKKDNCKEYYSPSALRRLWRWAELVLSVAPYFTILYNWLKIHFRIYMTSDVHSHDWWNCAVKFIITKLCKKRSNWQGKKHLITLSMLFSFNIQSSDREFAWHYKRETTWSIFYNWNRTSPCLKESDDRGNFYASWVTKPRKLWLH